ncbi:MAG: hypothetical protein NDI69_09255 [Bacteriovoracaceae bacterium]|nr:hypothetical protein [Bacteriovoracaceae bacterium]
MKRSLWLISMLIFCISCGKESSNTQEIDQTPLNSEVSSERSPVNYTATFNSGESYKTLINIAPIPSKVHTRYIDINIKRDLSQKELNYTYFDKGAKVVKIVGLHLVLGGTNSNQVYDLIKKTTDIKSLHIDVEKLEINGPVHVAGSHVFIKAKEVIFSERGLIETTPVSKSEKALALTDGVDGLNAGDITILTENLVHTGEYHLKANGGNGQDAGPGQDGARGNNAHVVSGSNIYESETETSFQTCTGSDMCMDISNVDVKKGRPSGNGQDARSGGRPGNPGNAGKITLNHQSDLMYSSVAGKPGVADINRIGGQPGNPVTTCKENKKGQLHSCVTALKGRDALAPKAEVAEGLSREIQLINERMTSSSLAKMQLKYAKDLYRNNHINLAQQSFIEILNHLELSIEKDALALDVQAATTALLNQISLHKDFFGKSQTWTPNISFEVNYKTFEQEIQRNLKILYFTEWLHSNLLTLKDKSFAIKELQTELFKDIDDKRTTITKLINQTTDISVMIEDIKVAEDEFNFELKLVEKEILAMAKSNLQVPFHQKALALISAASRAIPVGQPTFGIIGTGVDFIDQIGKKDTGLWDIVKSIPATAKAFKGFDWKKANNELNSALNELDPGLLADLKTNKERLAYLERLGDFTGPLFTAVSKQMEEFKKQEVSKTKLDEEIKKIQTKHPLYTRLITALNKLHAKKEQYRKKLSDFTNKIEISLVGIQNNYISISNLHDDLAELNSVTASEFINQADEVKQKALDRLSYYHYLFSKSYEYRFLKPYHRTLSYDLLLQEMTKLITINAYAVESAVEALQSFYMNELTTVIADIIKDSVNRSKNFDLNIEYHFSKEEIEALNNGDRIFIDLTNFFDKDKEDIRLKSVRLMDGFTIWGNNNSDLELVVQHLGLSIITQGNNKFIFEHANANSSNLTWISYKGTKSAFTTYSETSSNDENLFRELFKLGNQTDIFVRPGGETFLSVKLKKDSRTTVSDLNLNIEYQASFK